ncbi:MAG: hypothetical protein NZ853_08445 [Leptospiraceae bacterium]|nr:hypothetical protein [Leptospiraceae bacterium]MDW7976795.1 hypothetical protein [Leptospiraceae bacterium]
MKSSYTYVILFVGVLGVLQSISGSILFFSKIGYQPSQWMEYYYGSEEMRKYFPQEEDRFKEPLTFSGRLKVVYSHALAYGIWVFTLSHLIRSLNGNPQSRQKKEKFLVLYFIVAALEILMDILLTLIVSYRMFFLFLRFVLFLLFIGFTIILSGVLILYAWRNLLQHRIEPINGKNAFRYHQRENFEL